MAQDVQTKIEAAAEDLATAAGLDLVGVEVKGQGSRQVVRVIVDRKGGVDLAACQQLSKALSAQLDATDPVPGGYTLEVTSPGVDHPLEGQRAFDRVEGKLVRIIRHEGAELRGTVRTATDDAVVVDVDGEDVQVPYAQIAKATQALPW